MAVVIVAAATTVVQRVRDGAAPSFNVAVLDAPSAVTARSSDNCASVTIRWGQAQGADSYVVERRSQLGEWTALGAPVGNVTVAVDAPGASATPLEYRVRARDAATDTVSTAAGSAAPVVCT